jgi:hypothetical protein
MIEDDGLHGARLRELNEIDTVTGFGPIRNMPFGKRHDGANGEELQFEHAKGLSPNEAKIEDVDRNAAPA